MTATAAQIRSLPALYRMRPSKYLVARKILRTTAPVTLIGLDLLDGEYIAAGAKAAGRSAVWQHQPGLVVGYGRDHSGCLTIW